MKKKKKKKKRPNSRIMKSFTGMSTLYVLHKIQKLIIFRVKLNILQSFITHAVIYTHILYT